MGRRRFGTRHGKSSSALEVEGRTWPRFDFPPVDRARLPRVLAALRDVAGAAGLSVARVALAWHLTRPFVTSVIIGAKTREQLDDNLAAADVTLSPEHVEQLDGASALSPEYPGWILEWQKRDVRGVAGGRWSWTAPAST
ncbi:aldo/keto reductase [Sorangium sp. So ce136]|uniref:aldo/keto reductase n=1 Tax=Sorangium sp. So ce136 TaxID=3133284 RepID=UPI003F11B0A6